MTRVVHSVDVIAAYDDATELSELNAHGSAGDHFGWVATSVEGSRYVADGVAGPAFEQIRAIAWSNDGHRFCYAGVQSGRVTVMANHEPGPGIGNLSRQVPPSFSPEGQTLIYGGGQGSSYRLYINHVPQSDDLAPIFPGFSADGSRLGWVAQKRRFMSSRQWAVIDGSPGPETRGVASDIGVQFSPGSRHSLYAANFGKGFCVVRDGVVGTPFRGIGHVAFSPDGERFAVAVLQGDRQLLSVDGTAPQFDAWSAPVFSPDGRRLAWVAKDGDQFAMLVDGVPVRVADDFHDTYRWSPDARRLAYQERTSEGWRLISDDVVGPTFDATSGFLNRAGQPAEFSIYRGRGPIFLGKREGQWSVVVDNEPGRWFDAIESFTLSLDGDHIAYIGRSEGSSTIMLDGEVAGRCAQTVEHEPSISPDGQHVAYVSVHDGGYHLAVDDNSSPEAYEGVAPGPYFTPDGAAHGWAVRGSTIYRLSASPS